MIALMAVTPLLLAGLVVALPADPGDFDGDRIPDALELVLGTDPRSADATTVLSGRVVFDDGAPAEGASVTIPGVPAELVSIAASADGAFTLPVAWPVALSPLRAQARLVVPGVGAFEGGSDRVDAVPGGLTNLGDVVLAQLVTPPGSLFPGARQHTGFGGRHVADAVDLDGDGRLDLVQASALGDLVRVHRGTGEGRFDAGVAYGVGDAPHDLLLADFDGDAVLDLVTANRDSDDLSVLLGMPNGRFSPALNLPVGDAPQSVAAADLDLDGDLDLVAGNSGALALTVLVNQVTGFATTQTPNPHATGALVALADLDADGAPDLVSGSFGGLSLHAGLGDGSFDAPTLLSTRACRSLTVADVDLDGRLDLMAVESASLFELDLYSYAGLDGGGLAPGVPASAPLFSLGLPQVDVGDMTGDGLPDVLVSDTDLQVLRGVGTFSFSSTVVGSVWPGGSQGWSVVGRDLDADGDLDLLTATDSGSLVALNEGDGSFAQPLDFFPDVGGPKAASLMARDLNADGLPELLYTYDHDVVVQSSDGGTGFSLLDGENFGDEFPRHLVLAHFDADTTLDLATVEVFADQAVTWLLESDGTFQSSGQTNPGPLPGVLSLAAGDVNGDGFTDLVAGALDTAFVMLGEGTEHFDAPIATALPGLDRLAVGELNGDAHADALVGDTDLERVTLHPGLADGSFGAAANELSVPSLSDLVLADLNADGEPDLITSSAAASSLSVFLGSGDGSWTLAPGSPIHVGGSPRTPSVADVDGDGIPDVVVSCESHRAVLLGRADGSFAAQFYAPLAIEPDGAAIADFNADGAADLAGSSIPGAFAILYGLAPR